ncbi:MAG: LamG domain-containing protein, partial [Verrucomicrobiota bacterium]
FFLSFSVDAVTRPYPLPFVPKPPFGSLVYDPPMSANIATNGDVDAVEFSVEDGQTISVSLEPGPLLEAVLELRNPLDSVVSTAVSGGPGQPVLIQAEPSLLAGTYTLTISSTNGTTGSYDLEILLNAVFEEEAFGLGVNNTAATAQSIDPSEMVIGGGPAARSAVRGRAGILNPTFGLSRCTEISFPGYEKSGTLTDFPVLIQLSTAIPGFDYADFRPNAEDLRFTDVSQTLNLSYEIDRWDTNGTSYIWVRLPQLNTFTTRIFACWGSTNATLPPTAPLGPATWRDDYVGVWHLSDDGGSGIFPDAADDNEARDEAGSDTTTIPGIVGEAQDFAGMTDELVIANEPNFDQLVAITVSAWFRVQTFDVDWQTLIAKGEGNEWRLRRNNNTGQLAWRAGPGLEAISTSSVDDGQWHHVVATKGPTGNTLYIDGIEEGRDGSPGAIGLNNEAVRIGENPDAPDREWNGDIDEVRISSVARASNWVWACHQTVANHHTFTTYGPVTPTNTPSVNGEDWYAFSVRHGDVIGLALASDSGNGSLELIGSNGVSVVALGTGVGNADRLINDVVSPFDQTWYARILGADSDYTLLLTRNSAFEEEDNNDPPAAQGVALSGRVLGGLEFVQPLPVEVEP